MFRTELTIAPQERQLARTARVLTVGSCFADSIGERLRLNKVTTLVNPFGTVFQPLALAQLLRAAAGEEQDWQQHVVEARGRWQSYDFHGSVGADSPVELLQAIQQKVKQVADFLCATDLVVLTLGTAWAYRLRETGELVSNLHKLPASLFEKELLTADEIVNSLAEVHALLRRINPNVRIVLTVSPVRHVKDTLPLNAVSKSVLRVACHYLSELLPGVSYFPAFELLNDDLRDYRFYASDMLHPSEVAEDYIWDRFARAYFDADFGRFRKEWAAVRQSLTHRPLHLGAPEHRTFLDQTAEQLERLVSQGVEVRQELRDVQRQLAALPPPRPARTPELLPEDDGEERIDIGSDEIADGHTVQVAPLATQPGRPREERNRGRNRRGRGRDHRPDQAGLTAQPATPELTEGVEVEAEEVVAEPVEVLLYTSQASLASDAVELAEDVRDTEAEAGGFPAKKKKRRSRGGAKRTARKHAARLAAEQLADSEELPEENFISPVDQEVAVELTAEAVLPLEEAEPVTAESAPASEAPLISAPVAAATTASEATELSTIEPLTEPVAPVPASARKRGTGPTPKKSKVITKSSQVKRPKRTSLFRNAGPERPVDETPAAAPAEAPIISTPILPVTLLERPAVAELVENPAAALPAAELTPDTPAPKARRGRPKKAETAAAGEPAATAASPEPAPAARPARATKPRAAASKPAGSSAATKRGRSPGKKTPPPTEAPAA